VDKVIRGLKPKEGAHTKGCAQRLLARKAPISTTSCILPPRHNRYLIII
jgi:hypothetical protein